MNRIGSTDVAGKKVMRYLPGLGVALIIAIISFVTWWFLSDT